VSDAAPPPWVRHTKSPGLTATLKYLLIVLWGWGDYTRTGPEEFGGERQPAKVEVVWACRDTLARESGQPKSTVKKQLARLVELGWIRRTKNGTSTELAWREPHRFTYGWPAERGWPVTGPERPDIGPDQNGTTPVQNRTTVAPNRSAEWSKTGPHNVPSTSNQLPINVGGDAPATPPPSESPDPQPTRETRHEHDSSQNPDPNNPPRAAGLHAPGELGSSLVGSSTATPEARGRHEQFVAQRKPDNGRADLSPEVEAAVREGRMGGQLLGLTYRKSMLEALDEIGILEEDHAAMVAKVCEYWRTATPSAKPAKGQVWYRKYRDWQRAAMGLGKPKGNGMSGGIVPSRPLPDWDGEAERRAAQ